MNLDMPEWFPPRWILFGIIRISIKAYRTLIQFIWILKFNLAIINYKNFHQLKMNSFNQDSQSENLPEQIPMQQE